jgi:hypothetical protein
LHRLAGLLDIIAVVLLALHEGFDELRAIILTVDATINAPSSTNNQTGQSHPETHVSKKGNQWYFGMKEQVGTGSRTKLIHALSQALPALLHGAETPGLGDSCLP